MSSAKVKGAITNLVNGISQQAPALRLPTQAELVENFYPTIVEGLKDRPPTEVVARLSTDTLSEGVFSHIINRDINERYTMFIEDGEIKVVAFDGTVKTVNAEGDDWSYLDGVTDPATQYAALTVADYTFIVNKKKTVAMDSDVSPSRPHEALINVMAGNYGKTYKITINGNVVAEMKTGDGGSASHSAGVDTVAITKCLIDGTTVGSQTSTKNLDTELSGPEWTITRYQNAIHIENSSADFTLEVEDGFNGNSMKGIKKRTQRFADLPNFGPDGYTVEVVGDANTGFDNYYVKIEAQDEGAVVWRETIAPNVVLGLDASTMPHLLVRETDGSFTFKAAEWDPRTCGDADINPQPSFVGRTIETVLFTRNRLGFLADESGVLSRGGSFFNFFRGSATALLDDDPIDVAATHVKVSLLKNVVPHQEDLLIFSEQTQFRFSGNDLLTPKTASLKPISEYNAAADVPPVAIGTRVFFTTRNGDWVSVREYYLDRSTQQAEAVPITGHCPAYIPKGVFKIAATSNEDVLCALTKGERSALYLYKYYWAGEEKVQSAWVKWTYEDATLLNAEFIDSDLYLVIQRADGVYLEKQRLQPNVTDTGLAFVVNLDQRIHTDDLSDGIYDEEYDVTEYTLPYGPSMTLKAVTAPNEEDEDARPCLERDVASVDAGARKVFLEGDTTGDKLWFGYEYTKRYRFSPFYARKEGRSGSVAVQEGRLQVADLTLVFNNTAYFTVEVRTVGRAAVNTYTYSGRKLGSPSFLLGQVPLQKGKKNIPIMSLNERVTIDIINDSWMPSSFLSAEWTGTLSDQVKD